MSERSSTSAPVRREIDLDFIRGVAILLVIDFHAYQHPIIFRPLMAMGYETFGWVGVDLFFVLSGFLVGGLLAKEWKLRGRVDAGRFLLRRAFKIWPLYYVFLVAAVLTGHHPFLDLLPSFLNVQNYWPGGIPHLWTLAVEEHAYLVLGFVFWIAAARGMRMRYFFGAVVTVAAAILVNTLLQFHAGLQDVRHTDTRVDGILYGVLLAIVYHYRPDIFVKLQRVWVLWVGVIVASLVYMRLVPVNVTTVWWANPLAWLLANLSGVALLLLLYRPFDGRRRPAVYRWIAWVGLYSYGIYLWHVSVLGPVEKIAARLPAGFAAELFASVGPYVGGIALGVVMTKLIEFPALRLRDRLVPRRIDAAAGIPAGVEAETGVRGARESVSA